MVIFRNSLFLEILLIFSSYVTLMYGETGKQMLKACMTEPHNVHAFNSLSPRNDFIFLYVPVNPSHTKIILFVGTSNASHSIMV